MNDYRQRGPVNTTRPTFRSVLKSATPRDISSVVVFWGVATLFGAMIAAAGGLLG